MPRPKQGYLNAAKQPVPATGDINGRFMNRSRLMYWAYNRGKAGLRLYDDVDLSIGSCVHTMCERDFAGDTETEISRYARIQLPDVDMLDKAMTAFAAFREWRDHFHVWAHMQEISLVSERYQFGGTLDTIANIRGGLGSLEFKTSAEVYEDHVLQMGAYSILWEETHPDEPLTAGHHLILLPKDGAKFIHREFSREQIEPFRVKFLLYRQAYDLETVTTNAKVLSGIKVQDSLRPEIKPRVRVTAQTIRNYDHLEGIPT